MHRALVVALSLSACRLGFDPVEGDLADSPDAGGVGTMAATITAAPGSDFVTSCTPGQPCSVDCTAAAACIVNCNGASGCDVECGPVGCLVNACIAPACEVSCASEPPVAFGASVACN